MVNVQDIPAAIAAMLAQGQTVEQITALAAQQSEANNRAAQEQLVMPSQEPQDWAARASWLDDGQAIHGVMTDFYWPATVALRAGDQAGYARQMDLVYKALRTMFGGEPPAEYRSNQ